MEGGERSRGDTGDTGREGGTDMKSSRSRQGWMRDGGKEERWKLGMF